MSTFRGRMKWIIPITILVLLPFQCDVTYILTADSSVKDMIHVKLASTSQKPKLGTIREVTHPWYHRPKRKTINTSKAIVWLCQRLITSDRSQSALQILPLVNVNCPRDNSSRRLQFYTGPNDKLPHKYPVEDLREVNCQTCLPGWQVLEGRCYLAVSEGNLPISFETRRLYCLQRRGDLAKFDPPATFQFQLANVFGFSEYYIGLTDQQEEGDFRWIRDNTVPSSFPWAISQPDGGAAENCVVVTGNPATWSDTACNRPLPFICERPAENPPCGSGPLTNRIIGGSDAVAGEWPWYGSIRVFGILPDCGVTLISEEWAITAAHCHLAQYRTVVFGQHTHENDPPSPNRQESDITWFVHPFYDAYTLENDIALIYLHTPVTFTDFVRPACIYDTATSPAEDSSPPELTELTNCHIVGLGFTTDGFFSPPDVLQEAPIEILPPSSCSNYGEDFFERIMLCAGNADFSVDTCSGDSGGGLYCQRGDSQLWTLSGITSFGVGCGVVGFPGVYTRLSTTRSFVDSTKATASSLFRCPGSGRVILDNQVCNNIVDCEDYEDERWCGNLEIGQVIELSSPKFGMVTNLINRRWIFFPPPNRGLSVLVTNNNLVSDSGILTYLENIEGASLQTVPAVPLTQFSFAFSSAELGAPIILSMEKTAINSVAGFQTTIRVA